MRGKYKSIFRRLILSVLVSIIVPIIIMGISIYFISQNTIATKVDTSIRSMLGQVNINIGNKLKDVKDTTSYYATHKGLKNLLQQEVSLETVQQVDEIISNFMLGTNKSGQQVTIGGNNKQIFINWNSDGKIIEEDLAGSLRQTSWYNEALENDNKDLWITNMNSINRYIKQEKYISMIKIIDQYNRDENNIGFVVVSIPEDSISDLFEAGTKSNRLTGYVVNEGGKLISHIDNSRLGEQLLDEEMNKCIKQSVRGSFVGELDGIKQVIFYETIPFTEWKTIFAIPYKYYNEDLVQIVRLIIGIVVGAILAGILISTICSRSILKPINQLIKGMDAVSKGDLEYQVVVNQNNEIGILTQHFNSMTIQINELLKEKFQQQEEQKKLEILKKNTELQMLRAQINPHFLFNTLNSIKCLALINNAKQVAQMIGLLGKLLEASIGKGKDEVTVKEEIELLNSYIEIQKMRYGNKIEVQTDISEEVLQYKIPQFILQPIIENAMKHGLKDVREGGRIEIHGYKDEGIIVFKVIDNGVGISDEALAAFRKGENLSKGEGFSRIGMKNINERIQMIFGKQYGLEMRRNSESCGTTATIEIPIIVQEGI